MNELMTMEEFDSALRALFFSQCESALSELHIDEVPESIRTGEWFPHSQRLISAAVSDLIPNSARSSGL